jgi:hypothetical protein
VLKIPFFIVVPWPLFIGKIQYSLKLVPNVNELGLKCISTCLKRLEIIKGLVINGNGSQAIIVHQSRSTFVRHVFLKCTEVFGLLHVCRLLSMRIF